MSTKLQRVDEMNEAPIVGRMYLVPCLLWGNQWRPVVGGKHTDADLGVPEVHIHFDLRFTSKRELGDDSPERYMRRVQRIERRGYGDFMPFEPGQERIEYRVRKCLRVQPEFPVPAQHESSKRRFAAFEAEYTGATAKGCRVCPHRGMRLDVCPTDSEGGVVCPGHGLRWNRNTGKLMPRIAGGGAA